MKRVLNKSINIEENLSKYEQLEKERVEKVLKIKDEEFKRNQKYNDENDGAFFFSVVFDTRSDRDKWLKEHNIVLTEDFFVKARDFNI